MKFNNRMFINTLRILELKNLERIETEVSLFSKKRKEKFFKNSFKQAFQSVRNVFISKLRFYKARSYNCYELGSNRTLEEFERDLICDSKFYQKKIAVYTCIIGGYDNLNDPVIINENIDYFVFTDHDITSKIWTEKDIPQEVLKLNDNTLVNRYLKFHPKELFPEYDYVAYVDGNVKVISDITPLFKYTKNLIGVAFHSHSLRNSIYDEVEVLKIFKRGVPTKLDRQVEKYRKEGFPSQYGLPEATIILSDLSNSRIRNFFEQWWQEFLKSESFRDQISLPYILWKNDVKVEEVTLLGNNLRYSSKFYVVNHK